MGKQADVKAAPQPKQQTARWPFDPKRVQKQTGAGPRKTEPRRSKT
jgi:hypothetical protein